MLVWMDRKYLDTKLDNQEKEKQNQEILDRAAKTVVSYWTGATFDNHPVVPIPIPSKDFHRKFKSAFNVTDFLSASIHDIKAGKYKEIMERYVEVCRNIDRRANEITFYLCQYFTES